MFRLLCALSMVAIIVGSGGGDFLYPLLAGKETYA